MPSVEAFSLRVTWERPALLLAGAVLGALGALALGPGWLPALTASLAMPHPKAFWYLARVSGLVAYLLLWSATMLGLLLSSKLARRWPGGPAAADVHQFVSLLALAVMLFHSLILLGDRSMQYTLGELLVPFGSSAYRRLAVGLGQLGFYLTAIVAGSFYVRRHIGPRNWRLIHYGSFAVYVLVTLHGLGAGTDTTAWPVQALYSLCGLSTNFFTVYRLLGSVRQPHRSRHRVR